ncbi:MAG: tRNA epoxyqueuosine(34) reductase QueG [Planctomycetota bacterium]|nr:tRNA epoxyqueuosine(34) reductase QueG [Planctomycetota bacterium]
MGVIQGLQYIEPLRAEATRLGFDRVGIASAEPSRYRDFFRRWLDQGQSGSMDYLANRFEERTDPGAYLPEAASIVCVAMNYFVPLGEAPKTAGPRGRIARYALGVDYHEIIKPRLHALADWLRIAAPEAQTRCCVDTAPVMEKELAGRAGVGWMGKNTCIINEEIGSWLLLGEIVTTLKLPTDDPAVDRCGTCRRCIDACPTEAITEPYKLDARKCISYLTIEHRGEIALEFSAKFGDWIYGCDICQDVCPWNRKAEATKEQTLAPRFADGMLDLNEVLNWTDDDYRQTLRHSAMKRIKLPILKRNAAIALKNLQTESCEPRKMALRGPHDRIQDDPPPEL